MATSVNLNTHVLSNIPKGVYPDHAFDAHPTTMLLINKATTQNGGLDYRPNRIYGKDETTTWFAGTSLTAAISSASQTSKLLNETYNWSYAITPMTVTPQERNVAVGDSEFVKADMLDVKRKQAKLEHMDDLAAKIMQGDGSSNTPYGLVVLINPASTFGGVDPSADTDWVSNTVTSATVYSGPHVLTDAFITAQHQGKEPDIAPMGATLWAKTLNILGMGIQVQNKESGAYKLGIQTVSWMGMDLYLDRDMPSTDLWMLCSKVIDLKKSSKFWMKVTDPKEPTDGTNIHKSLVGDIYSVFILGATERRVHTGYTSLT